MRPGVHKILRNLGGALGGLSCLVPLSYSPQDIHSVDEATKSLIPTFNVGSIFIILAIVVGYFVVVGISGKKSMFGGKSRPSSSSRGSGRGGRRR